MQNRALVLSLALLVGCGGTSGAGTNVQPTTVTIGALGGVIQVPNGPSLAIVPGSLAADTAITVTPRTASVSGALSTVYDFTPAGLTFARPATLSIPVDPSLTAASLMVTGGSSTATLPALVDNGVASAQVTQLSSGYAAASQNHQRTVSGTVTTVYWADNGTKTTRPGSLGASTSVTAAWVPAGSNYRKIAISPVPTPEGGFVIDGVPEGPYLLQVDTTYEATATSLAGTVTGLYEMTTSSPDLSAIAASRPDVELGTGTMTVSASNLTPWQRAGNGFVSDLLSFTGSQNTLYGRPVRTADQPPAGGTTWSATFDWAAMSIASAIGLPDASKGDVEYFYQRSSNAVGSGATAGMAHTASRYARLTDLTLHNGGSASTSFALVDAPQTGTLRANIGNSKWAQLLLDSNPNTVPNGPQGVSLLAIPHSITYPDEPYYTAGTSLAYIQAPPLLDADYGTLHYGQFLGSDWKEVRYVLYLAQAQVPQPGTSQTFLTQAMFTSYEAMPADDQIVPVLGPPRSPKIAGHDAFQALSGVGTHPTISWTPPRLGSATSYRVSIFSVDGVTDFSMTVYGVTSLQIPNGFLHPGTTYTATITSISAPWDALDQPPLRLGVPYFSADTNTAAFTP